MENPTRARSWKRRIQPRRRTFVGIPPEMATGGQGVRRETESERLAEKCRAVAEAAMPWRTGRPKVGKRSSLHYGGEGVLIPPPHQGVCGRHGTEDLGVTPGDLARVPAWQPGQATL